MPPSIPASFGTISYTAPTFSEKDLIEERLSLSSEQRAQIDEVLLGTRPVQRETDELRVDGLQVMRESLEQLDIKEKESYLQALRECPELVESETDPLIFLRSEDYDGKAAAKRLAKHWYFRCQLFGERAFQPMIATGTGALTPRDVELLRTGVVTLLPNDDRGRSVIFTSRSRVGQMRVGDAHVNSKQPPRDWRSLFYLLHVAAQDPLNQRHGYILVVDSKDAHRGSFVRKKVKSYMDLIWNAAPMRLSAMHLTYPDIKAEAKLYLPTILWYMEQKLRLHTRVHSGCPNELVIDLQQHGLSAASIPSELGGSFDMSQVHEWLHKRRDHEEGHGGIGPTPID